MVQFPQHFLWGAATSSYQVEGNNANADWWPWEIASGKERSGLACRHYELYEQDFDLAKSLNHNAHRFSIEWSRIEPQEGQFAQKEIQHYIGVIKALRARGIEPVVTLHHFTNPIWLSDKGGWTKPSSVKYFLRYCDVIVKALANNVHCWITINEPTIYASHAFNFGTWPPQERSIWKMKVVCDHLIDAHIEGYSLINKIYKQAGLTKPLISISHHMASIVACRPGFINNLSVYWRDRWFNFDILNRIARHKAMDFIGLNYYSWHLVEVAKWWDIGNFVMGSCPGGHHPKKKNSLNWDICPEGLYEVLVKLNRYKLPIMITENGICTSDDNLRWEFIQGHLRNIHRAINEGVDVSGYLYWSLMDNFEWAEGFRPRFGLIDINYTTFKRTVKESALKFAQVCKKGVL